MEESIYLNHLRTLNQQELYQSAEILGHFLISCSKFENGLSHEGLTAFADSLYEKEEYRRALFYYQKAILAFRPKKQIKPPAKQKQVFNLFFINFQTIEDDSVIRFKAAKCYMKLGDAKNSVKQLEGIPLTSRTVAMNLLLAKGYQIGENEKSAIAIYKEVIKQNPLALEAAIALFELGVPLSEVTSLFPHTVPFDWIERLLIAHSQQCHYEYQNATESFAVLEKSFPNNVHTLHQMAKCEIQVNKSERAKGIFEKIRHIDPYFTHSMDTYASILKSQGNGTQLNQLVTELIRANPNRPECWTSMAMYCELKMKKEKAVEFIDKALEIDERHVIAYLMKGNIFLTLADPNSALLYFKKAYNLHRDLYSFTGLVRGYLMLNKLKEALNFAKEAHKIMPKSPQSLTLMGVVLGQATNSNIKKKARQYYEEALKIDKNHLESVMGLVQLCISEQKHNDALKLLEETAQTHSKDFLHIKIAEIQTHLGKHDLAIEHLNAALSINPNSESAKASLDKLQRLMRGDDPDEAMEEEDEAQANEEDEDV